MHSEHTDSARTAVDQPDRSGARFTAVFGSEFTFLGRRPERDWLATGAATPPAPSARRPSAPGHGHPAT